MAVNIMCVASRLWMKLGGKAVACFDELTASQGKPKHPNLQKQSLKDIPSEGALGSEIYTVCTLVII